MTTSSSTTLPTNNTEIADLTHEELAAHARAVSRCNNDSTLADLAAALQTAVDNESPSTEIAQRVVAALGAA